MFWNLTQVALGGAIGAAARYVTVMLAARLVGTGFPWGTLTVNTVGSLAMGMLAIWLETRGLMRLAPLLMSGILGGFTTFSAFSLDAVTLGASGDLRGAAIYIAASVGLSIMALLAGMALMRGLT